MDHTGGTIITIQEKVDQLNQEAWDIRVYDSPRSFKLSEEAVSLSRKINYKIGLAHGTQSLGFCHIRLSNNNEALPLVKESLALFEELNDLVGQSCSHEYLALIQRNWGDLGGAVKLLFKALELAEPVAAKENISTIFYQLGVTYKYLGNFEKALELLDKSLAIHQELKIPLFESYPINIIGSIYFENGDYPRALEYYKKALKLRQDATDQWGEAGSLDNAGFTYLKLKDYKQAIAHCTRSLEISKSTDDKRSQGNALIHLAEIFKESGDIEKAISFSNESLKIRESTGDKRGQTEILLFLAELHGSHSNDTVQKTGDWLSTALKIAEEMKAKDLISRTLYQLYEHHKKMGQPVEAMGYLASHVELEKQLHKNTIDQKVTNLEISRKAEEARKETEQVRDRNRELTTLNNEIARQKEELEGKNRELEIESAVERVRAKALAMHQSEEILGVVVAMQNELKKLNISGVTAATIYLEQEDGSIRTWDFTTFGGDDSDFQLRLDYRFHIEDIDPNLWIKRIWNSKEKYCIVEQDERDFPRLITFLRKFDEKAAVEIEHLIALHNINHSWHPTVQLAHGKLNVDFIQTPPVEMAVILPKMGVAFDLAYKRFQDLKNAESQAREAQIEAALEKVRSSSMAMHQSKDLHQVINIVCEQLFNLGFKFDAANFVTDQTEQGYNMWLARPGENFPVQIFVPQVKEHLFGQIYDELAKGKDFISYVLTKEEKDIWFRNFFENTILVDLPSEPKENIYARKGMAASMAVVKNIRFNVANFEGIPYSDEENAIIKRFAAVFEQSYTRFLDLQKAEAQAREAQIEASLERVRSKAMAMHKSEDLNDAVAVVFDQLRILDLGVLRCGIGIMNKEKRSADVWVTTITDEGCLVQVSGDEMFDIHPLLSGAFDSWLEQKDFSYVLKGEDMVKYYEALGGTNFHLPESQLILHSKDESYQQHYFVAVFEAGGLFAFHEQECPDETKKVLKRFAGVFNLTYQRFLDIQKAEANTREAKIEASLERVRAKAMGMHTSDDLSEAINLFYHELGQLEIVPRRCGVSLIDKDARIGQVSSMGTTEQGDSLVINGPLVLSGHPVLDAAFDHWVTQKEYHVVLKGEEIRKYYEVVQPQLNFPGSRNDEIQYGYYFYFPEGCVFVWTTNEMKEDELEIFRRFTSVLSLTYRRYKELIDAEERARARLEDFKKLEDAKNKTEAALNELQATQSQLIQAEKMASLGELTAGIAHEIQNPLNFVNNFSEVNGELIEELNEQLAPDSYREGNWKGVKEILKNLKENEEKINHHGKRADAIVKSMLQHSRISGGKQELTDINALVDEYLRLAFHGLRAKDNSFNAKLETQLDPAVGKINIVPQDIGRVLINLINNGFYAVNEKRKITGPDFEPLIKLSTRKLAGGAEIRIEDNGNGIPDAMLEKIFQPFFTTKPTGEGTGLGLSLSYDIVKAHGGELKVETNEGQGSEFTILLPTGSKESI